MFVSWLRSVMIIGRAPNSGGCGRTWRRWNIALHCVCAFVNAALCDSRLYNGKGPALWRGNSTCIGVNMPAVGLHGVLTGCVGSTPGGNCIVVCMSRIVFDTRCNRDDSELLRFRSTEFVSTVVVLVEFCKLAPNSNSLIFTVVGCTGHTHGVHVHCRI